MLQVCLNGARGIREHHHLPVQPPDLAAAAAHSVAAGAEDIHVHPKTHDGADSLDATTVAAAVNAVRAAAPGIAVGIPTTAWTTPDTPSRLDAIASWTVLPDHASVDWHDPDAERIAHALLKRGIGIEAGIHSGTEADEHFAQWRHREHALRILTEIVDPTATGATATAETLLARIRPTSTPILLHGRAAGAWPVLRLAEQQGLHTRIGLEDTLLLPDGTIADDNAQLVTAALHIRTARG
ncbi:3-keto-5-aminohexanoate cleavage protein [Actinopolyspora sp. H202]|uniref:3-keto-5-aminohexanoate cleavage protein n=1 Tax=Actinopolyspora sp. H202 TaxID=1500456 RepID=UPI003EE4E756